MNRFWQMLILIILTCSVITWGEEKSLDRKLGEISYPIYVSHVFVLTTYGRASGVFLSRSSSFEMLTDPTLATLFSLVITIIFSFILIRFVKPVEKMRDKNRN